MLTTTMLILTIQRWHNSWKWVKWQKSTFRDNENEDDIVSHVYPVNKKKKDNESKPAQSSQNTLQPIYSMDLNKLGHHKIHCNQYFLL